jgi:hypothetical protein
MTRLTRLSTHEDYSSHSYIRRRCRKTQALRCQLSRRCGIDRCPDSFSACRACDHQSATRADALQSPRLRPLKKPCNCDNSLYVLAVLFPPALYFIGRLILSEFNLQFRSRDPIPTMLVNARQNPARKRRSRRQQPHFHCLTHRTSIARTCRMREEPNQVWFETPSRDS